MQVTVKAPQGLERSLTIIVPAEKIDQEVDRRIKELSKTAKLDGFRKGKVPFEVLKKRVGQGAREDVLGKVIEESFSEAIEEKDLRPAGQPNIKIVTFKEGEPLEYEATFENYPEFELVDLTGKDVEQIQSTITDSDVETMLTHLQKQHTHWEEVDRPAENDDQLVIDFEGFMDGKAFDGGKATNIPIVLGSHQMIPGFEEGLVGAKAGQELEVKTTFPKDYFAKDLAGKEAIFKMKVHTVSKPNLPELNDDFAQHLGIKEGGLEKLRSDIKKRMTQELQDAVKMKNKTSVMNKLLQANKIDLPQTLVESEITALHQQAKERFAQQNAKGEMPDIPRDLFEKQARRRIALGILVGDVVKKHTIKPDPDRVSALIESLAGDHEYSQQMIEWYKADKQRMAQFELVALEDQVVDKLLESANVKAKEVPYEDAMKPATEEEDAE